MSTHWRLAPPWLATGQLLFLSGNLIWLIIGDHTVPGWISRGIDALYFSAFLILGHAVRHATATDKQRATATPRPPGLPCSARLLMAPAVILLEMSDGAFRHGLSIATSSAIMSVLVVGRLTVLR